MDSPNRGAQFRFADRVGAGRVLAGHLSRYARRDDVVVLGLPRGGIPVAAEVARALDAPLDAFVVRKLGVPGHPEYAMGAIASGGVTVLDEPVVRALNLDAADVERVRRAETLELRRREVCFREGRPPISVNGRTAVLVDDGLATGATMQAAVQAVRAQGARRIVVAVPLGSADACARLEGLADDVVCPYRPEPFHAVGCWYDDFEQTTDDEVRSLLAEPDHA